MSQTSCPEPNADMEDCAGTTDCHLPNVNQPTADGATSIGLLVAVVVELMPVPASLPNDNALWDYARGVDSLTHPPLTIRPARLLI